MNNYERIAETIRFLDRRVAEQPDLAELARHAGLSRFHFHRLFSAWAGVTPKEFLQCLTLTHARTLLERGNNVLDTAFESGLSGPGRLHDLCVQLEAASPGELKSGGAGWTISCGFADSPFGRCFIGESPRGVCHLSFCGEKGVARAELQKHWPRATIRSDDTAAEARAAQIFNFRNGGPAEPLRAYVRGTPFQVLVWRALLRVKPGRLTTYSRLARTIGKGPAAARAVGSAVARNPLGYLIPCHRVIRETGAFGEYHWGGERKRAMIAWESHAGDKSAKANAN